jgi:hypothetical protein
MEAAGAPRLDVERLALVRRSTRGAGVGCRGGTSAGNRFPPMPLRRPRNEARALTGVVSANCALGTLAY